MFVKLQIELDIDVQGGDFPKEVIRKSATSFSATWIILQRLIKLFGHETNARHFEYRLVLLLLELILLFIPYILFQGTLYSLQLTSKFADQNTIDKRNTLSR